MPESAEPVASVQTKALTGRTIMRLKPWLPEYVHGERPVVLAGRELPSKVGATLSGAVRVLCIGPGDWLIVSPQQPASSLREHLEPDLARQGLALVDTSDGLATFEVCGAASREMLSKGCGLDLHPRSFAAGACARTRLAQVPVVIECLDAPQRFELTVARSYASYLQAWLVDAAAEFVSC
jgi:sarcosine oxidase subunit gamma